MLNPLLSLSRIYEALSRCKPLTLSPGYVSIFNYIVLPEVYWWRPSTFCHWIISAFGPTSWQLEYVFTLMFYARWNQLFHNYIVPYEGRFPLVEFNRPPHIIILYLMKESFHQLILTGHWIVSEFGPTRWHVEHVHTDIFSSTTIVFPNFNDNCGKIKNVECLAYTF